MPARKIIHIDMDAFYASVEQRDNPELRGRPVAVGQGAKRGVVAAASYEARAFGVRSAMPSTTAMRRCAELVFVPPRFDVYRAMSREIHAIFADYTALIEPLSLDEAYLDVTQDLRGLQTASATAQEIRSRIFDETGLTASAGISYNKFLAKLASGQRKPNGQFVITPDTGPDFIASLPVAKFHGVGPVTAAKMQRLGIQTGGDLRAKSLAFLQQHFGKSATWYLGIANGEDERPVVADRPRKSSGSETTFERDLTSSAAIEAGAEAMADLCLSQSARHTSENVALICVLRKQFERDTLWRMTRAATTFACEHSRAPPGNPGGVFARTSCGGRIGDQSDTIIYLAVWLPCAMIPADCVHVRCRTPTRMLI